MPAVQTLMNSIINGSTDLGSETTSSDNTDTNVSVSSTAAITFVSANGAVLLSGNFSTSAPTIDWDINGGTYFSFEKLQYTGGIYDSVTVKQGTTDLTPSSMFGENRYQMTSNVVFRATASTRPLQDVYLSSASGYIRVSIWDAATAGNRKAFGFYDVGATAQTLIDESGGGGLPP